MKKLTSFALGPILGLLVYYFIDFVYELIESLIDTNLDQLLRFEFDVLLVFLVLILLPVIFYFLLSKKDEYKQRVVKSVLFFVGVLFGFGFVFFVAMSFCFGRATTEGCSPFYAIV